MKSYLRIAAACLLTAAFAGLAFSQSEAEKLVTEYDVNGLKVLVKRRPGTPTISAGLFIRGGSRNLTPQNAGIEKFMLDVATEGGKQFPRDVLRKEISRTATQLGSDSNRDYSVMALGSTKQNFDASWKMFIDVALEPAFAASDVERVRANIINSLRSKADTPDSALQDRVERSLFAGHAYANEPDGTIDNISRFQASDLAAYHKQVMQTSRLLLVLVGDVDPAAIQKLVTTSFGMLPRGSYKDAVVAPLDFSKGTLDVENRPLQTDYVQGNFASPTLADPDFYAMRVAVSILQTQVYQEVRVKRNLSYAPDAGLSASAAPYGFIYVTSTDPNQSVRVMLDVINSLKTHEVTDDVIRQYGNFFLTTYYLAQESNGAQTAELARYELIGGGWRRSFAFLPGITKVTPAEVKAAAQKYMKNIRFAVVGTPAHIDRTAFVAQN